MANSAYYPLSPVQDWDAFRSNLASLSKDHLEHGSQFDLDPSTLEIAKTCFTAFPISQKAQQHLDKTLRSPLGADKQSEQRVTAPELISEIAKSEEGLVLLGVIGVLTEYYNDASVATVLDEIAKWLEIPTDLRPSPQSWQSLTTLLARKFASAEFSTAVDKYTKLGEEETTKLDLPNTDGLGVAAGLCIMADIVRGRHPGGITTFVGKDSGWLAAVAEWLFGLRFELRAGREEMLYASEGGESQMTIRFRGPGVPCDGIPLQNVPLVARKETEVL